MEILAPLLKNFYLYEVWQVFKKAKMLSLISKRNASCANC